MDPKEKERAALRAELASLDESARAVLRQYGGTPNAAPKSQAPVPSGVGIFVGMTNFKQYDI